MEEDLLSESVEDAFLDAAVYGSSMRNKPSILLQARRCAFFALCRH